MNVRVFVAYAVLVPSGKSALHWAAAVNNVAAAIMLLKSGANKDMQNNKVSKHSQVQQTYLWFTL